MGTDEIGELSDQLVMKAESQFRFNTFLKGGDPFLIDARTQPVAYVFRQFARYDRAAPEGFGLPQFRNPPFAVYVAGRGDPFAEAVKVNDSRVSVEPVAIADGADRCDLA